MRRKLLASIGLSAALWCAAMHAQTRPKLVYLNFTADVQADGSLANVEPDATMAPLFQAMLRKQVAGWRYRPGTWQGKPVPKRISQRIVAEVVQAGGAAFALRMKEVTGVAVVRDADPLRAAGVQTPPRYPKDAQRQGIEATMVYAMRRDPRGAPIEVELVDAQVPAQWRKAFDETSRQAISSWRLEPVEVAGQPIDCRSLVPVTYQLGEGLSPPSPKMPDLEPYLPRVPDSCPLSPVLETPVAGVFL